ncbi:NAD-dependent epimerase/dehydratase family protein [Streptomyces collinus]
MAAFSPRGESRTPWDRVLVTGGAGFLGSPPPVGPDARGDALDEADPVGPHRACAEAVRFAEALAAAHTAAHGWNAGIVRLFDGYGPGMRADGPGTPAGLIEAAPAGRSPCPGTGAGHAPCATSATWSTASCWSRPADRCGPWTSAATRSRPPRRPPAR